MARRRRNPQMVLRGFKGLMPTTEPSRITGLIGKKIELACKVAGFTIYRVDGRHVRAQWADFIGGGHAAVYHFIPKHDIWIDSTVREPAIFLATHELLEAMLMDLRRWKYDEAHAAANQLEQELRGKSEINKLTAATLWEAWAYHLSRYFPKGDVVPVAENVSRQLWKYL